MEPLYTTSAISSGEGRDGRAALADGTLELEMAMPRALGGEGDGANPEQLFAMGYAACFHSALKAVGGRLGKPVAGSTVTAEVTLQREGDDYSIAVRMTVSVPRVSAAEAHELIEAAHEVCPYSKATRGNIAVELAVA